MNIRRFVVLKDVRNDKNYACMYKKTKKYNNSQFKELFESKMEKSNSLKNKSFNRLEIRYCDTKINK